MSCSMTGHYVELFVQFDRRHIVRSILALLGAAGFGLPRLAGAQTAPAPNQEKTWRHGVSLFGDLKYPAGFKHFDYVNPQAPKAGVVRMFAFGTFDNFNVVVAGVKGSIAAGLNDLYDTLMAPALDEVSAEYGLLAEAVSYPP